MHASVTHASDTGSQTELGDRATLWSATQHVTTGVPQMCCVNTVAEKVSYRRLFNYFKSVISGHVQIYNMYRPNEHYFQNVISVT